MARPHDALAKNVLEAVLSPAGTFEREAGVPEVPAQRGDAFFVPDAARASALEGGGLLGRMASAPCLFEAFHDAPGVDELTAVARKLLHQRHARTLAKQVPAERVWVLSAGRPVGALEAAWARPAPGWPAGVYATAPMFGVWFVVIPELPEEPSTLAVRLLGRGRRWVEACRALETGEHDTPRGRGLRGAVHGLLARGASATMVPAEEDDMFYHPDFAEDFEEYRVELLQEGIELGKAEGKAEERHALLPALLVLAELRLGRALSDAERGAVASRVERDGASAAVALSTLDATALAGWIAG